MIEAGQIYFLRKIVNIGEASYGRPCLVLRARPASSITRRCLVIA